MHSHYLYREDYNYSNKMVTTSFEISSLQLASEGTIPVQETNPAASSKMVAGMEARARLQLAGGGVCSCRNDRSCPLHQEETGQGCSVLVTLRATCELGTHVQQETGQGCSVLVTLRATCELVTQQETGQGCSMLVTPRATCELGTQQPASLVFTASTSVTSQQEVDRYAPSIVVAGISMQYK